MAVTIQHLHATQRLLTQSFMVKPHTCTVHRDTQSAYAMSANPHGTKSHKFINLRHNYIYNLLDPYQVTILYVSADRQKSGILTNPLQRTAFKKQCNHLKLTVLVSSSGVSRTPYTHKDNGSWHPTYIQAYSHSLRKVYQWIPACSITRAEQNFDSYIQFHHTTLQTALSLSHLLIYRYSVFVYTAI